MQPAPVSLLLVVFLLFAATLGLATAPNSSASPNTPLAADLVQDGQPIDLNSPRYQKLFAELTGKHSFSRQQLDQLFAGVTIHRKVLELMDRPWEAKPYYQYRPLFITPSVIRTGKEKLKQHQAVLDRIEDTLGVNREVLIGIWAIESRFGKHCGAYPVFRTLNTLFAAYPRRADFFRSQLIHFLLLCRENRFDPLTIKGSYAGAFGQTQFIPSSYREYAISFDGDQRPDVFNSVDDILASIANYLKRFKWVYNGPVYVDIGTTLHPELQQVYQQGRKGRIDWRLAGDRQKLKIPRPPSGSQLSIVGLEIDPRQGGGFRYVAGYQNFHAITAWNHSNRYAMVVSQLAEALRQ